MADLDTRLARNRTEHRLAEKKSKRDVDWSDTNVLELEAEYRMTSSPGRGRTGRSGCWRGGRTWSSTTPTSRRTRRRSGYWRGWLLTSNVAACLPSSTSGRRPPRCPSGDRIFSLAFSQKAPYFATIRPRFTVIEPNRAELVITKRRRVHNHIKTVHAIALCNGLEAAMGALAESTIPRDRRWIPKGMEVAYTAKADSDVTCIAETDPAQWTAELGRGLRPAGARAGRTRPTAPSWSRARSGSGCRPGR